MFSAAYCYQDLVQEKKVVVDAEDRADLQKALKMLRSNAEGKHDARRKAYCGLR